MSAHGGNGSPVGARPVFNDGVQEAIPPPHSSVLSAFEDTKMLTAVAHALRCPELQPSLFDGLAVTEATVDEVVQAVLETAEELYVRDQRIPQDHAVLAVETNRRKQAEGDWSPESAARVSGVLEWCFGPEPGVIQPDRGRELWNDLVTSRVLAPLLRNTGANAAAMPQAVAYPMQEIQRVCNWLEDLQRNAPRDGLRFISSREFAETDYSLEWHVPNMLVKGQPCVIGGPSKSLKTSLAIDLAVSLAAPVGNQFLGRFDAEPARRVLFVSAESGEGTIKETVQRICRMKAPGVRLDNLNITWCFQAPKLSCDADLQAIRQELDERPVDVAIFDPLYLCLLADNMTVSASNLYEMGPLLRKLSRTCLDAGATPVLVHHFNKPGSMSHDPPALENLAFAGIGQFTRQWLLINRRAKYVPGSGLHELWLSVGGSAGHSQLWGVDVAEGQLGGDFGGRQWQVTVHTQEE
ncbi:MAG: AAA family ATPase, partial [Planctomycetales bacterium]